MKKEKPPARRLGSKGLPDLVHGSALVFLLALGTALRIAFLSQPMHLDETYSYLSLIAKPLSTGLTYYPSPNNHLLNTLLSHVSVRALSTSGAVAPPWVIRLPAFLAGILIPLFAYLVFRKLFNRNVGLLATAFIVPSSLLIEYSTNARGYTLLALIFLALVLVSAYALQTNRWRYWGLFAVLCALGFYTIPTMLYFFVGLVVWIALSGWRGPNSGNLPRFLWRLALAGTCAIALSVLLYVPVVIKSGLSAVISNDWVRALALGTFVRQAPGNLYTGFTRWNDGIWIGVTAIILLGFLASIFVQRRYTKYRANLAITLLVVSVVLLVARHNLPPSRVWIPLLPVYLGYSAVGFYWAGQRALAAVRGRIRVSADVAVSLFAALAVCAALFLGASVIKTDAPYQQVKDEITLRDAGPIAAALKTSLQPGDVVVTGFFPSVILRYYFMKDGISLDHLYADRKYLPLSNDFIGPAPNTSAGSRTLVLDATKDGYPISSILKYLGVNAGAAKSAKPVLHLGDTTVYLLTGAAPVSR